MNILLKWDVDLLSLLKYWIHYPANHLFLCRHFQGLCGVVGRDLSWWMFHRYSEKFMTNQTSKDSNTKLWMWSILSIPTFRTSAAQLWIWKNMFMVNNFLSTFAFRTSTLFYWMTRTALYTISLENHIKKSPVGRLYTLILTGQTYGPTRKAFGPTTAMCCRNLEPFWNGNLCSI